MKVSIKAAKVIVASVCLPLLVAFLGSLLIHKKHLERQDDKIVAEIFTALKARTSSETLPVVELEWPRLRTRAARERVKQRMVYMLGTAETAESLQSLIVISDSLWLGITDYPEGLHAVQSAIERYNRIGGSSEFYLIFSDGKYMWRKRIWTDRDA